MLCPGRIYTALYGECQAFTSICRASPLVGGLPPAREARGPQWTRGGRGNSDLGGQLGVLLFVDQVLELPWIFDADAQQPPRAIRLGVDDIRVIERLGVDLDDLAADRRLDRDRKSTRLN